MLRALSSFEGLLLTTAVAAISAGVTVTVRGDLRASFARIARVERAELARAVARFRADTGYLPLRGPFALAEDGGSVPTPRGGADAYYAPANWEQLLSATSPLADPARPGDVLHPLGRWDPVTERGWRGPYLSGLPSGWVHDPSGAWTPAGRRVRSVPQAFPGSRATWFADPDATQRATLDGAPYLHDLDPRRAVEAPALRAAGPDGRFGTRDDVVLSFEGAAAGAR